jgi:uncharacterized protein YndB with AHSA1/START domain
MPLEPGTTLGPYAVTAKITLDGPFETGTRGATKMTGQPARSWRLAEVHGPERAVIEWEFPGAVLRSTLTFEDVGDRRTRVTQHMSLDGPSAEQYAADVDAAFAPNLGPGMEKMASGMAQ